MTIITPAAAHATSQGMIRVAPGKVSPTAAAISATPRNIQNERGYDSSISAPISGGGARTSHPCAKNATASNT